MSFRGDVWCGLTLSDEKPVFDDNKRHDTRRGEEGESVACVKTLID